MICSARAKNKVSALRCRIQGSLKAKGFQRHLGSYETAEEAARCYDRAALKLRGDGAELNFPRTEYDSVGRAGEPRGWGGCGTSLLEEQHGLCRAPKFRQLPWPAAAKAGGRSRPFCCRAASVVHCGLRPSRPSSWAGSRFVGHPGTASFTVPTHNAESTPPAQPPPLQDDFLAEHAKTDKFRFLDALRARFSIQVGWSWGWWGAGLLGKGHEVAGSVQTEAHLRGPRVVMGCS